MIFHKMSPRTQHNYLKQIHCKGLIIYISTAVRRYGKDFQAMAEVLGNKSVSQCRNFFVNYKRRFNLQQVLEEYEAEQGITSSDRKDDDLQVLHMSGSPAGSSGNSSPSQDRASPSFPSQGKFFGSNNPLPRELVHPSLHRVSSFPSNNPLLPPEHSFCRFKIDINKFMNSSPSQNTASLSFPSQGKFFLAPTTPPPPEPSCLRSHPAFQNIEKNSPSSQVRAFFSFRRIHPTLQNIDINEFIKM